MGSHNCACCHTIRQLIIPIILLLISSLSSGRVLVQDKSISKLNSDSQIHYAQAIEEKLLIGRKNLIGSRPPRCERKCNYCDHCEPIQVPIVSLIKSHNTNIFTFPTSRGDDISNYKPICWKCKCGNFIFDP